MKIKSITGMGANLLAMALLAGCGSTTPGLDAKFGDAVNIAKAQQTINKNASQNTDPAAGLDGESAKAVIDRYHKGYESPSAAPTGSIGTIMTGGSTLK